MALISVRATYSNLKSSLYCYALYFCCVLSCLLFPVTLFAQRLNFTHYSLDDGLIQSQVTGISQDKNNHLWLSTLAGANRFDGKNFVPFTVDNGLENIALSSVKVDNQGRTWLGSSDGLTCYDGQKFVTYNFLSNTNETANKIALPNRQVWALSSGKLFKLSNGKLKRRKTGNPRWFVTDLQTNSKGELFIAIYNQGIFKLEGNIWKLHLTVKQNIYVARFGFEPNNEQKIYFTSKNRFFKSEGNTFVQVDKAITDQLKFNFTSVIPDQEGGYWMGASEGAVHLSNHKVSIYNKQNGFTNNHTTNVFIDTEKNVWFITNGDGLYKLDPKGFELLDETQGVPNSIMGIAKGKNKDLWLGTINSGIYNYSKHQVTSVKIPSDNTDSKKITNLLMDSDNRLWISTFFGGLWTLKDGRFIKIYPTSAKDAPLSFNQAIEDEDKKIWIVSSFGIFTYFQNKLTKIPGLNEDCSALYNLGNHKILVKTSFGLKMVANEKVDLSFKIPVFKHSSIFCMKMLDNYLYLGTDNRGLIILNLKNNQYKIISTKNGLYANNVYCLGIINHQLWLGTGLGINHFNIGKNPMDLTLLPENESFVAECNQNALLVDSNKLYIGTSKGLAIYSPYQSNKSTLKPAIVIQSVAISGEIKSTYAPINGYSLPTALQLPPKQNNIAIKFNGISLKDAKHIKYAYLLQGLDDRFSNYKATDFVNYSNLPPGKYTFKVKAIFQDRYTTNPVSFSFEVLPAFYQTKIFQLLIFILILACIYAFIKFRFAQQKRKILQLHLLRLSEQEKIRQQTAEDLHDDFGNKLTRINMLSELLDRLISKDNKDIKSLIQQIRFSATEMYAGTKDLLWALNPQNDALSVVIIQIKKIIEDTINHTNITFIDNAIDTDYHDANLPLGFSRNITLIAKELITNVVKHAKANTVTFDVEMTDRKHYILTFMDDGTGFDQRIASTGHGVNNMKNRALKLNGTIQFLSNNGSGTKIILTIILP